MLDENIALTDALRTVGQAKETIRELEALLPDSPTVNFRERLVAHLEKAGNTNPEFRRKAGALLIFYEKVFGVNDLVDPLDEE